MIAYHHLARSDFILQTTRRSHAEANVDRARLPEVQPGGDDAREELRPGAASRALDHASGPPRTSSASFVNIQ